MGKQTAQAKEVYCFSITQLVGQKNAMIKLANASLKNAYLGIKQTKESRSIASISLLDDYC